MLKLILSYICIIQNCILGYTLINGIIPYQKKYYISSQISNVHKLWIKDSMEIINPIKNLEIQEYYDSECIRIYYNNLRYTGFTEFEGYLTDNNEWIVDKIDIGISSNINYYNTFLTIMIHELLHANGCMHNDIEGSIMNVSILVLNNEVQNTEFPILHLDDISCLIS